jgi:phosphatidylserine decarboxylase
MRIPLTKYGWPQVVVFPVIIIAATIVCLLVLPAGVLIGAEVILAVMLVWVLSFFRDPERTPPADKNILLAPADGTIRDIEVVDENDFIGGKAMRIGIFLSIFDVHINRSPCDVKVEKITYKKGDYKDARNPQAGAVNESNDLWLIRTDEPKDRLIVRQISGAIARRIVCEARQEQKLTGGRKFGMIKFGSRTELYLPSRDDIKCLVRKGDKVKAGLSILARYE